MADRPGKEAALRILQRVVLSWGFPMVAILLLYYVSKQVAGIHHLTEQGFWWRLLWFGVCGYLGLALWMILGAAVCERRG